MLFKRNRERFLSKENLMFIGCAGLAVLIFAAVGYRNASLIYVWALMLYSSLILFATEDVSKTCVDKKPLCFALCVVGSVILSVIGDI